MTAANQIFVDPSIAGPDVILVGGACYKKVAGSPISPNTFSFDQEYLDCNSCTNSSSSSSSTAPCSECATAASFTVTCTLAYGGEYGCPGSGTNTATANLSDGNYSVGISVFGVALTWRCTWNGMWTVSVVPADPLVCPAGGITLNLPCVDGHPSGTVNVLLSNGADRTGTATLTF